MIPRNVRADTWRSANAATWRRKRNRVNKNKAKAPGSVRRAPGRKWLRLVTPAEWGLAIINPPEEHKDEAGQLRGQRGSGWRRGKVATSAGAAADAGLQVKAGAVRVAGVMVGWMKYVFIVSKTAWSRVAPCFNPT